MGLLNIFRSKKPADQRPALELADERGADAGAGSKLTQRLLAVGLDGAGPLSSATALAQAARERSGSDEEAIRRVQRQAQVGGGVGGVATGIGGFVTMPVALPVNVIEFYLQATRMVGAIATLRGYDISDPRIRTAVLLTLVGSRSDEVLKSAGINPTGRLADIALRRLPPEVLMLINKAIGVRLLRSLTEKLLAKLGRGIPFAGGAIGGALDVWMMKRIADHARREFPPRQDDPAS